MEIRMGGSYLDELKKMKTENEDLEAIEMHFLRKDSHEDGKGNLHCQHQT